VAPVKDQYEVIATDDKFHNPGFVYSAKSSMENISIWLEAVVVNL